jgi:putative ABC transport system substrate-binding protein
MKKKSIAATLCAMLLLLCSVAEAQQAKKIPRIGWLSAGSSSNEFPQKQALEGLRELGWIDSKNVVIEYRHAAGDAKRLAEFAAELVRLNVDVIVTFSAGVAVAKKATGTIPIVMQTSQDPVRSGIVASLARPGGNLTGVTFLTDELSGKRLELLKESIPTASRAAILWEPAHVDNEFKGMQTAAPGLGVRLQSLEVPRPARTDEAERAIQAALEGRAQALILAPGGFTILHRKQLIDLAAKHRLPVFSAWRIFADDGAILTYGPDTDWARRLAYYVDRVIKGAKPADLPVEQPMKFEFVINLQMAKQIGLTIPPNVLVRADRVIR